MRQVYTVLRAILADARLDGLVADNAALRVPRPRIARTEASYLEPGQLNALLMAAAESRYLVVLRLIAGTGLRRGEALALRWEHVDLVGAEIRVRQTVGRIDGQLVFSEVKTAKSRRTVPLSPAMVSMLKQHKAFQAADRLAMGDAWEDHGLVFCTELGHPVEPRNILRVVESAAAKAGLKDVGVHTLRHSAAVAWLEVGVHIRAVADLLGHSSIAITGDIYAHTSDDAARAAVGKLSDTFGL